VDELSPERARQLDLPPNVQGVLVTDVDPDSGVAELQKGDVIEEINQQPVTSVSDYKKVAGSLDPNQPQVLSVCRIGRDRSWFCDRDKIAIAVATGLWPVQCKDTLANRRPTEAVATMLQHAMA
jgi:hypothetical protein